MKIELEIHDMPANVKNLYAANEYPHSGVFMDMHGSLYFVDKINFLVNFVIFNIAKSIVVKDSSKLPNTMSIVGLGLTSTDLLKVIAVSKNPKLAKDLI